VLLSLLPRVWYAYSRPALSVERGRERERGRRKGGQREKEELRRWPVRPSRLLRLLSGQLGVISAPSERIGQHAIARGGRRRRGGEPRRHLRRRSKRDKLAPNALALVLAGVSKAAQRELAGIKSVEERLTFSGRASREIALSPALHIGDDDGGGGGGDQRGGGGRERSVPALSAGGLIFLYLSLQTPSYLPAPLPRPERK